MRKLGYAVLSGLFLLTLSACTSPKKVPYLKDAETIPAELLAQSQSVVSPVIVPGDLLNIDVSSINMPAVAVFNKGRYVNENGEIVAMPHNTANASSSPVESYTEYYLVDNNGDIEFPVIGKIHVAGLTKKDLAQKIVDAIYPKYVNDRPAVDIRLMNFRVTVAGAVRSPGVYQSRNERMTFLEAISMAGDLDIKGDRENILLYRTNADGTREVHRLNIHDKDFLMSPYFTLQQNDYIYVEPNGSMRQNAWQLNPAVGATITIVGGLSSVASLVIGIVNLTKK